VGNCNLYKTIGNDRYLPGAKRISHEKNLFVVLFLTFTLSAYCDVIFYLKQKSFLSYSAELIYSYEKVNKPKASTSLLKLDPSPTSPTSPGQV
jgi:hypothetical protein